MQTDPFAALQLMADSGLLILIWLVQLVIYPSFLLCIPHAFNRWHRRYVGIITVIVVPLVVCQVAVELRRWVAGEADLLRIALIGGAWLVTLRWSVPCHSGLIRAGLQPPVIQRLIRTNWARTLCWSLLFAHTLLDQFTAALRP